MVKTAWSRRRRATVAAAGAVGVTLLLSGCGGSSYVTAMSATPTPMLQPTPDPAVDAVLRAQRAVPVATPLPAIASHR